MLAEQIPTLEYQFCYLLAISSGESYIVSLSLSFIFHKTDLYYYHAMLMLKLNERWHVMQLNTELGQREKSPSNLTRILSLSLNVSDPFLNFLDPTVLTWLLVRNHLLVTRILFSVLEYALVWLNFFTCCTQNHMGLAL